MEKNNRKRRRLLIGTAVFATVASLATIGGATYAGYVRSEEMTQPVSIGRYLFLNPAVPDSDDGWETDLSGVAFYLYVYTLNGSAIADHEIIRSSESKYTVNHCYYFYISTAWTYCRFVRASANVAAEDVEVKITRTSEKDTGANPVVLNITAETAIPSETNKKFYNLSGWDSGAFATS